MTDDTMPIRLASDTRGALIKPQPRIDINIRAAEPGDKDFAFIDDLQKQHGKMVGFMHRGTLETYIERGEVLIAETPPVCGQDGRPLPGVRGIPLGYCIGRDTYFKREDVGIVYQLVVASGSKRKLVGAALIQELFERVAYGCKLFCCWCAQDLDANWFWESMGFAPIAFRTGSPGSGKSKAARIHIFWQKRIREGDTETPYWFPSQTSGGAIREDRLVIPIPPGTHWSDAKPIVLPGVEQFVEDGPQPLLEGEVPAPKSVRQRKTKRKAVKDDPTNLASGGLRFAGVEQPQEEPTAGRTEGSADTKPRRKPKRKYHPKYVAAARDLCARFLEELHGPDGDRLLPEAQGKYDVSRQLESDGRFASKRIERIEPPDETRWLDAA